MAKVGVLVKSARLSRSRAIRWEKSGMTRLLEGGIATVLVVVFVQLVWTILAGPTGKKILAERMILAVISLFWLSIPASIQTGFSSEALLTFPLTRRQRISFAVACHILDWKIAALIAASGIAILSLVRTSDPIPHMLHASGFLLAACTAGTGLVMGSSLLRKRSRSRKKFDIQRLQTHLYPVFHKELFYLLRTLDPHLAFLVAAAAGWTEMSAAWMTPGKAMIPLLLISFLQLPSILNPFALNSESEMERYKLLPIRAGAIICRKHLASVLVLLLTAFPLLFACAWRQPWPDSLRTFIEFGLVVSGLLLSAMLLMRTSSARMIRAEFWKLSGDGMSPVLFISAGIVAAAPVCVWWLIQSRLRQALLGAGVSIALIAAILTLYAQWLNRHIWLQERQNRLEDMGKV